MAEKNLKKVDANMKIMSFFIANLLHNISRKILIKKVYTFKGKS
jgi:hypothetical protein